MTLTQNERYDQRQKKIYDIFEKITLDEINQKADELGEAIEKEEIEEAFGNISYIDFHAADGEKITQVIFQTYDGYGESDWYEVEDEEEAEAGWRFCYINDTTQTLIEKIIIERYEEEGER